MRRLAILLATAAAVAACNRMGIREPDPYKPGRTTSVYGNWVLDTPADSTAFAGARRVELSLQPTTFVITAHYPAGAPVVIRGTAAHSETGELILTPESGTVSTDRRRALVFVPGEPITLLASASGGTLVFSPPAADFPIPSSVWHRREAAEAAGMIATDSMPR